MRNFLNMENSLLYSIQHRKRIGSMYAQRVVKQHQIFSISKLHSIAFDYIIFR